MSSVVNRLALLVNQLMESLPFLLSGILRWQGALDILSLPDWLLSLCFFYFVLSSHFFFLFDHVFYFYRVIPYLLRNWSFLNDLDSLWGVLFYINLVLILLKNVQIIIIGWGKEVEHFLSLLSQVIYDCLRGLIYISRTLEISCRQLLNNFLFSLQYFLNNIIVPDEIYLLLVLEALILEVG
jgi:hypothetical protein